jgi:hypothetical protein
LQVAEVLPYDKLPLTQILKFVKDKHPRVRAAACGCLAHMANDFAPGIQVPAAAHPFLCLVLHLLM